MRLRHTTAAVAATVVLTAATATATAGTASGPQTPSRISVSQQAPVGHADVTVRPASGGGWHVAAEITKTTATTGCLTLTGEDEDLLPGPLPSLTADADELGEHCGAAGTSLHITAHEYLVLRWDGDDGLHPAAASVHITGIGTDA